MPTKYVVVKRRGAHVEPVTNAPIFDERKEAEDWARSYLSGNPEKFTRGLDAIEVRPVHRKAA